MSGTAGLPAPVAARADPRVLAAGTTQRFVLLLILITVSGVQLASSVLSAGYVGRHDDSLFCLLAAGANPALTIAPPRASAAYAACTARYSWNPAWWWPLAVTGAAALVAAALYLWLVTGRRRVVPAADIDLDGSLTALVRELAETASLRKTPRLVVDPTAATVSAVAYGLPGHHTVCLHGGLVTRMRSDPGGFRAVVLHELAHIRNRDIGITYATVAAWRVYLVVLLPPASLSTAWSLLSPFTGVASAWESDYLSLQLHALAASAFMVALVFLSRADLLRTRETYADLDAARWGAVPREWPDDTPRRGPVAAFGGLWRSHPDWRQRAAALTDVSVLFRISPVQMFLTGGAASLILYRLTGDLSLVTATGTGSLNGPPFWVTYACAALAAALIAGVAGVQLWRAAARAAQAGQPGGSGFRAGLWLGGGLAAGDLLTGSMAQGLEWLPVEPAWLIILMFLAIAGAMWTADLAALAIQAIAWLAVGGSHLGGELHSSLGRLDAARATAAHALGRHTVSRRGLDSALAPVGAACAHLSAVDRGLEAFFPMPDAFLNSQWQEGLTGIAAGTEACEEGVIKSRSATPANINSIVILYFGILNRNIIKARQSVSALSDISALAEGQ